LRAEQRIESLRDAAVAARSANTKPEDWKKFLKSLGDDDAT